MDIRITLGHLWIWRHVGELWHHRKVGKRMESGVKLGPDVFRLIDACCEAYDNPAYQPRSGMTFCNQAVQFVAEKMGFTGFQSMMANEMVALMKNSPEWTVIPLEEAQARANQGHLTIAGMQEQPHGHVAVIRPGLETYSDKWAMSVPKVINVGSTNFIGKGLGWSFRDKPEVFVWTGSGA
jgi:hypothetical protein